MNVNVAAERASITKRIAELKESNLKTDNMSHEELVEYVYDILVLMERMMTAL